jgi:gamma-glutamyltranspeptidase/glutathione hydrolase
MLSKGKVRNSALAIGPRTIAGVLQYIKLGSLSIEEILKPIIALAEKGL